MSPLDDELRAALHRRATAVPPSPDPLAGVERRATRIRRNRLAASVAGSALAVAAVATAVPLLGGSPAPSRDAPLADRGPSGPATLHALDPDRPWDYRGISPDRLGRGTVETVRRELAAARGVDPAAVELDPLFGQVDEPSGQVELVYVAQVDGEPRWGVARSSEAGPEFAVDEPLAPATSALVAALPGDEVGRLLVVAAPEVGEISYGPDDASDLSAMAELADGVATGPLEGDPATDSVRVLGSDGEEVFRGPAPDIAAPAPGGQPANLLTSWPERGTSAPDVRLAAERAFAGALDVPTVDVRSRLLFGGADGAGNAFVLLQAWRVGDDAHTFGFTARPDGQEVPFLGPKTDQDTPVLAMLVERAPGQSTDTLVVVPEPGTGQVLHGEAGSELRPVGEDQAFDGVVLVDRAPGTSGDRLRLLDGDGDLDRPTFDGAVEGLLCGLRGCG